MHSGNSSVNLSDGANLSQTIPITGGCYFETSFFARGEGAQVGFTATVTFITPTQQIPGGTIMVRQQDMTNDNRDFAFYRLLTTAAPADATSARISFAVTASGSQSMDLDDVSFAIQ